MQVLSYLLYCNNTTSNIKLFIYLKKKDEKNTKMNRNSVRRGVFIPGSKYFSYLDKPKQNIWLLIPVKENIFYLRNLKYNEDLFASNDFDSNSR